MGLREIKQLDASTGTTALAEPAAEPKQSTPTQTMEILHDEETNTISFDIQCAAASQGQKTYDVVTRRVVMREPFPRDFFLMESWMRKAKDDYQDLQIALIKLATLCITDYDGKPSVGFEEVFNTIYDLDSSRRLVKALDFFPGRLSGYIEHLKQAAKQAGIQLPE